MFDIGWSELLIVGIVALIVIGPKELPGVLRSAGQWIGKVRRMAADFQGQFQEAMREAEMADLKKQVDEIADTTRDLTAEFDPIGTMQDAIDDPFNDKTKTADAGAIGPPPEAADPAAAPEAEPASIPAPEPAIADSAPPASDDVKSAGDADLPPQRAAAGGHSA